MKKILTVSELTRSIQLLLESNFDLIWIEGEISNLRRPGSGHVYFTLKDDKSQVRAVVFRQTLRGVKFSLEDGMHVICRGGLNVYEQRGEYQIIVDAVEPQGIGALQIAFEQLKARLQAEGLFDSARKRPIPFLAGRIGVITSPTGAVIRDILNISKRRFPCVHILIAPVRVQGAEAADEIVQALENLNAIPDIEAIILARGGGSLEDLAPFNDERVARAIFNSRLPVISAVGHEVDFTIADFVADLRAPTPSAAAELAIPLRRELNERMEDLRTRMLASCRRLAADSRYELDSLRKRLRHPARRIIDARIALDLLSERLRSAVQRRLGDLKRQLGNDRSLLENLNPLAVLKRGYAIARTVPDGRIVRSAGSVAVGEEVEISLSSGRLLSEVRKIHQE